MAPITSSVLRPDYRAYQTGVTGELFIRPRPGSLWLTRPSSVNHWYMPGHNLRQTCEDIFWGVRPSVDSQLNRRYNEPAINEDHRFIIMSLTIKSMFSTSIYLNKIFPVRGLNGLWHLTVWATGRNLLCPWRIISHYSHPGRAGHGSYFTQW